MDKQETRSVKELERYIRCLEIALYFAFKNDIGEQNTLFFLSKKISYSFKKQLIEMIVAESSSKYHENFLSTLINAEYSIE